VSGGVFFSRNTTERNDGKIMKKYFDIEGPEQNRTETVQNRTVRRNKTGF
jgi:hypothetical protein